MDEPIRVADGDYECPECHNQAYLIADEWTTPGTVLYFYECKSEPDCPWRSRNIPEAEYWEKWHPVSPSPATII